jgi:aryl-alcohol dehydrogenase-like predicted oxidoreductase
LDTRRLGRDGPKIAKVGVGTAPIGSTIGARTWGPQNEDDAIRAIRTALDIGVNWVDTAPFYGWGRSEQIVGKAIRERRDEVYIFTKCGAVPDESGEWTETDCRPETMRREVEESLQRLGTHYVDLLQLHEPDPNTPIEESWKEMQRLIESGKVRHGGLSNHPPELIERAVKVGPVVSSQNQYNPFRRRTEKEIFPFCQRHGIGVLGWGSLSEGVLTDGWSLNDLDPNDFRRQQFYALPENREKVDKARETFRKIARSHGKKMADVVIAWELDHKALTGAIIGVRNEKEAREMVGGVDLKLSIEEIAMIDEALKIWA